MKAYTLEEVTNKLTLEAVMVRELVKVKLIPINLRESRDMEFNVVNNFGMKDTISREELLSSGFTYLSGKPLKIRTMSSKKDVYLFKQSNESIRAVFIPDSRYVIINGRKVSNKYIIVDRDGNIGTCSRKVFRKTCILKPDVRVERAIEKNSIEKFVPVSKMMNGRYLSGYVFENTKTGEVNSLSVKESVELFNKGLIEGEVKLVSTGKGNKLGGSDIDKLSKLN